MASITDVSDEVLRHQVHLIRVGDLAASDAARVVREINDRVVAYVTKTLTEPVTSDKIAKVRAYVTETYAVEWASLVTAPIEKHASSLAVIETAYQASLIKAFSVSTVMVATPSDETVALLAETTPFDGKLMKAWSNSIGVDTVNRMRSQLAESFILAEGGEDAAKRIRDVGALTVNNTKAVARTYQSHYANIARDKVYEDNADLIESVTWIATLDHRTTSLCQLRDLKEYTIPDHEPINHSYSWDAGPGRLHWNCRSAAAPKLPGVEDDGSDRSAIEPGENYEHGDDVTRTGKVKKPTKANRDNGIYKKEKVATPTKYEQWLHTQATQRGEAGRAFVQDVLGKKKAELFRNGTPLSSMSDQFGSPLTLKELAARGIL